MCLGWVGDRGQCQCLPLLFAILFLKTFSLKICITYWIIFTPPTSSFTVCYICIYLPTPSQLCNILYFLTVPWLQFLLFIYSWVWVQSNWSWWFCQEIHHWRKRTYPLSLRSPQLSIAPHLVMELMKYFPLQGGMLTRLILGRQPKLLWVHEYSVLVVYRRHFLLWSSPTSGYYNLFPLLCHGAWALWGIYSFVDGHSHWHSDQFRVSALATIYYCTRMIAWWEVITALTYR